MKRCARCRQRKPLQDFSTDVQKRDGKRSWCKPCHRRSVRAWGALHPAEKKAGARRWYVASSGRIRDNHRRRLYGVTPEMFRSMLRQQKGRCAVCRTSTPGGKGSWHVDHDHRTKKVRGLLCHHCNVGLGNLKDSPALLRSALKYLR